VDLAEGVEVGASGRDRRAPWLTPVRAVLLAVVWIAVGVVLRTRVRPPSGCGTQGMAWVLLGYCAVTLFLLACSEAAFDDPDEDSRTYRRIGRLAALVVGVVGLSGCLAAAPECSD
jgi:hypothetical protein